MQQRASLKEAVKPSVGSLQLQQQLQSIQAALDTCSANKVDALLLRPPTHNLPLLQAHLQLPKSQLRYGLGWRSVCTLLLMVEHADGPCLQWLGYMGHSMSIWILDR